MNKVFINSKIDKLINSNMHFNARKPVVLKNYLKIFSDIDWIESKVDVDCKNIFKMTHCSTYIDQMYNFERENGYNSKDKNIIEIESAGLSCFIEAMKFSLINNKNSFVLNHIGHHAHYGLERGFCTFHLGVAAMQYIKHTVKNNLKLGILDLDFHIGDGTNHIIKELKLENITHYSSGYEYTKKDQAEAFLSQLPTILGQFKDCDLVIYHSGVDVHDQDQVGGWLSTTQLFRREKIVYEIFGRMNLPVVYCTGGGYQRDKQGNVLEERICFLHSLVFLI